MGQLAFFTWQCFWSFRHDSKALPGELWRGDQPPGLIAPPVHFFFIPWSESRPREEHFRSSRTWRPRYHRVVFSSFRRLWWLFCAAFGRCQNMCCSNGRRRGGGGERPFFLSYLYLFLRSDTRDFVIWLRSISIYRLVLEAVQPSLI